MLSPQILKAQILSINPFCARLYRFIFQQGKETGSVNLVRFMVWAGVFIRAIVEPEYTVGKDSRSIKGLDHCHQIGGLIFFVQKEPSITAFCRRR